MSMPRKASVTVRKPLILGSYAFKMNTLEKKNYGEMTHRWTCLLRSPKGEDLSYFIKKVIFELDPSFLNSKRTLLHPPYEVSEAGWGEFFICVKLYFVDETIEPVKLTHYLKSVLVRKLNKLFLYFVNYRSNLQLNPMDPNHSSICVASETYDECLFHEPYEWFYEKLMGGPQNPPQPHRLQEYFLNLAPREKEQIKFYTGCQAYIQTLTRQLMVEATLLTKEIQASQQQVHALMPAVASTNSSETANAKGLPYSEAASEAQNIRDEESSQYSSQTYLASAHSEESREGQ
ncbi:putative Gas41 [Cardiosporidium cionae]|uniref:Gas41 n=1 Tax=Cardiosporidium cionae TaxID=476202 RepID=A0ABQ7JE43_9APIC|nr:putative Gas41 [Cardiosporidium cionae]|eukprot:KAF8822292.1 putative Gas41 [Cardiosporidium cionae]